MLQTGKWQGWPYHVHSVSCEAKIDENNCEVMIQKWAGRDMGGGAPSKYLEQM